MIQQMLNELIEVSKKRRVDVLKEGLDINTNKTLEDYYRSLQDCLRRLKNDGVKDDKK